MFARHLKARPRTPAGAEDLTEDALAGYRDRLERQGGAASPRVFT
jgi:hypothetical protein